jgi:citrate lyase subunit beta/citryl-CoA lyase
MRLRRSLLFVCGAEPDALEAARRSAADGLILDLEDTVTPDKKPLARRLVGDFLRAPARAGLERTVRVNASTTPWGAEDVTAVVAAGADALVIPKVESPEDVHRAERQLDHAERQAGRGRATVRLLALVETPLGVLNAYAIATASARLEALVIGHVDLSRTLGIKEAGAMEGTVLHARCQLVLAAKAASLDAIDAVFMDLRDPDGFSAEARQGLRLGFGGKLLISERQVPLVHAVYQPSEAEIAYARRLIAAWEAALAGGTGVFVFEGRVIDRPVVDAERTILVRAGVA